MKYSVGDHVVDRDGHEGIIVKIIPGTDDENHGIIYVWQLNDIEYGVDNCEHYAELSCRQNPSLLRILKKAGSE